jgi:hypothetical protein
MPAIFPNDSGYTDYSSTGASQFIPQIWSGKLQVKFYKSTVLGDITNNDWEGEIKGHGDKVIIRSTPDINIVDYTRGLNLTNQIPTSTPIELLIDKGKYFSVIVDDVNKVQSDLNLLDTFTNDAGEQMKIGIDTIVLNNVAASAATKNKGSTAGMISNNLTLGVTGTPITVSATNVIDNLMYLGQALDEQNVPESGRWAVIPAWMARMLKMSDLKNAYLTGDGTSPLRNGKVGQLDRFTLYVSNCLTGITDGANTCYNVLAGTKQAISFASQITNMETLRSPSTFGNIVRGLNVFGYKVTKPEALAVLYCKQ